ncbi:MAG: hypothetical protein Q7K42_03585, partial [Candidatus Diapherotrites archaeon]|nr:hypothetical protein [Candidatus Diapherotrites archaeon]
LHDRMIARIERYGKEQGKKRIVMFDMHEARVKAFQRRATKPVFANLQEFVKEKKGKAIGRKIERKIFKLQNTYTNPRGRTFSGFNFGIIDLEKPALPQTRFVSRTELERIEKQRRIQNRIAKGLPITKSKKNKRPL